MRRKVDILLIALSSPIKIGIYDNSNLVESIESTEKSSDILPILFGEIFDKYDVERLFYANGPGSFMAIKIAYIFLKSISILKDIPLFATDAFKFNQNSPIKAIGKLYFVRISDKIETKKLEDVQVVEYLLPQILDFREFSAKTSPIYAINAVG